MKSLAGFRKSKNCTYSDNAAFPSDAFINCVPNMETGPVYGSLNVMLCPAKYQTTKDLEKLDQVEIFDVTGNKKQTVSQYGFSKFSMWFQINTM